MMIPIIVTKVVSKTMIKTISLNRGTVMPFVSGKRATKVAVKPRATKPATKVECFLNAGSDNAMILALTYLLTNMSKMMARQIPINMRSIFAGSKMMPKYTKKKFCIKKAKSTWDSLISSKISVKR